MKLHFLFIGIAMFGLFGCGNTVQQNAGNSNNNNYQLVWQDDFDYTGLPDTSKWLYDTEGNADGWGNNEAQYYTEADSNNVWVNKGVLKITAQKEAFAGKSFTSARLSSATSWQYGRFETRAKVPNARGTWSAIWMMPEGWSFKDGNWPDVGEIDIMEHVGHVTGVVHASAHSKDYQWQTQTQQTATMFVPEVDTKFHTYILEWSPKLIKAFIDDSLFFQYDNEGFGETKWPYTKPFNIIMNVAVGGTWGGVNGVDTLAFPQTMEVDFVRVYQRPE